METVKPGIPFNLVYRGGIAYAEYPNGAQTLASPELVMAMVEIERLRDALVERVKLGENGNDKAQ